MRARAGISRGRLLPGGLLAALALALGCSPPFESRVPSLVVVPARMVVLSPLVHDLDIATGGEAAPRTQVEEALRVGVDGALARFAARQGARVLQPDETVALPAATRQDLSALYRWASVAVGNVTAQKTGRANYHRTSVGDWRFDGDLAALVRALRADTALFAAITDRHETTGHRLRGSLEGNRQFWQTFCAACLIDLRDGRLVWCDAEVDAGRNLDDPTVAAAAVDALLAGLSSPTGASK